MGRVGKGCELMGLGLQNQSEVLTQTNSVKQNEVVEYLKLFSIRWASVVKPFIYFLFLSKRDRVDSDSRGILIICILILDSARSALPNVN